jgi:hypothetical protein
MDPGEEMNQENDESAAREDLINRFAEAAAFCEWYRRAAILADFYGIYVSRHIHPMFGWKSAF